MRRADPRENRARAAFAHLGMRALRIATVRFRSGQSCARLPRSALRAALALVACVSCGGAASPPADDGGEPSGLDEAALPVVAVSDESELDSPPAPLPPSLPPSDNSVRVAPVESSARLVPVDRDAALDLQPPPASDACFEYLGDWIRCENAGWPNLVDVPGGSLSECFQVCLGRDDCTAVTDWSWLREPELGCSMYVSSCEAPSTGVWHEEDAGRQYRRVCAPRN